MRNARGTEWYYTPRSGDDFNEESIDVVLPADKMSIFDVEDQIRLK